MILGSKALHSNIWPLSPFTSTIAPTPETPPLLLGISGLQLKGLLVSEGRWGSGGGGSEEVNSPRGYRAMSCFICKAQCWLSLLTASHAHTDRTTAGSCAFQSLLREYFILVVWQNVLVAKIYCRASFYLDCVGVRKSVFKRFNAAYYFSRI